MPRPRTLLLVLVVGAFAALSSGCVAIKQQAAIQTRLPGFVTLLVDVCVSDRDKDTYGSCNPTVRGGFEGTAEPDGGFDGDEQGAGRGQLMVGYRVPNGSAGPASFISLDGQLTMSRNAEYTAALLKSFPPANGFHWEGYLSSETQFDPLVAGDRTTSLRPEFTLPRGADGAPFTGPYKWRPMVGFRATGPGNASPAGKVDCNATNHTLCFDSPGFSGGIAADLSKAVSDIGVLPGSSASVLPGETATVDFSVRNADAGGLGARTLSLSAATTVPNGSASAPSSLSVPANGTTGASVSVAVPLGTPPGDYTVTLNGSANAGVNAAPLTRSNTGTITVLAPPPGPAAATPVPTPPPSIVAPAAPLAAPGRIVVTIAFDTPDGAGKKSTTFSLLQVKGAPSGATVEVRCKGPRCPAKSLTKRNAPRVFSLKPWIKKPLRAGTVLTVTVTKPGSFGMVKTFKVRASKRPAITERCLAPGSKTSRAACA